MVMTIYFSAMLKASSLIIHKRHFYSISRPAKSMKESIKRYLILESVFFYGQNANEILITLVIYR